MVPPQPFGALQVWYEMAAGASCSEILHGPSRKMSAAMDKMAQHKLAMASRGMQRAATAEHCKSEIFTSHGAHFSLLTELPSHLSQSSILMSHTSLLTSYCSLLMELTFHVERGSLAREQGVPSLSCHHQSNLLCPEMGALLSSAAWRLGSRHLACP